MFGFNYFSSIDKRGFRYIRTSDGRETPIRRIKHEFRRGVEYIHVQGGDKMLYTFCLKELQWFNDNGVVLEMHSIPKSVRGKKTSLKWLLSR